VDTDAKAAAVERAQEIFDQISLDYADFSIERLARWLEQKRGREIHFTAHEFSSLGISGLWAADESCEYVCYELCTSAVRQDHIKLHELSHIALGHTTVDIGDRDVRSFLEGLTADTTAACLLLRSLHSDQADLEAEALAFLIQEQALRCSHSEAPATAAGNQGLADYIAALDIG
jgi:hypothetical protein